MSEDTVPPRPPIDFKNLKLVPEIKKSEPEAPKKIDFKNLKLVNVTANSSGGSPKTNADYQPASAEIPPSDPRARYEFHSQIIPDPFRPLEDPNTEGSTIWIKGQVAKTRQYLDEAGLPGLHEEMVLAPDHWKCRFFSLYARLEKQWKTEVWTSGGKFTLVERDKRLSIYKIDHADHSVDCILKESELAWNGLPCTLQWCMPSPDGRYLAYAVQGSSLSRQEGRVYDTLERKDLNKKFKPEAFNTWGPGSDCFYTVMSGPQRSNDDRDSPPRHYLYYHSLQNDGNKEGVLVLRLFDDTMDGDHDLSFEMYANGCLKFCLHLSGKYHHESRQYVILSGLPAVACLLPQWESIDRHQVVGSNGSDVIVACMKRHGLGNSEIRKMSSTCQKRDESSLIADSLSLTEFEDIIVFSCGILVRAHENLGHALHLYSFDGKLLYSFVPGKLSAIHILSYCLSNQKFVDFATMSYDGQRDLFQLDLENLQCSLIESSHMSGHPADLLISRVMAVSKDGTEVPMTVIHRKDTALDSNTPAILEGYGGFNAGPFPWYSPLQSWWVKQGGVYAVAHIRGDGGWVDGWTLAGSRLHKQNTFDDFAACAKHLCDMNLTRPGKLASYGFSNGGLTVAATMLQNPDLFGAVVCVAPITDMMNVRLDWGSSSGYREPYGVAQVFEEFMVMKSYSPLHNVKDGAKYPPVFIMAMGEDEAARPGHALKFLATLKDRADRENVALLHFNATGYHRSVFEQDGKESPEVYADILRFLHRTIEIGKLLKQKNENPPS